MGRILLRHQWTQQPQGPAVLDRSTYFGRTVDSFYLAGAYNPKWVANGPLTHGIDAGGRVVSMANPYAGNQFIASAVAASGNTPLSFLFVGTLVVPGSGVVGLGWIGNAQAYLVLTSTPSFQVGYGGYNNVT